MSTSDDTQSTEAQILARLEAIEKAVNGDKSQLSREDLRGMRPEAIVQAQKEGRLADILKGSDK